MQELAPVVAGEGAESSLYGDQYKIAGTFQPHPFVLSNVGVNGPDVT